MVAKTGFYALALGLALVIGSGAMVSDDARAQDEAMPQDEAAARADDVTAQDEAVAQPAPQQRSVAVDRPAKSDLDQSAVRAEPVTRSPRPTRTSIRAIAVPKILGSYR